MSERFYTVEDASLNEFYQLPKTLVKNPIYENLSSNALVAYAILKDRHSLSCHNKWYDEKNRVFFYFKDQDLADTLHKSLKTAKRIKKELKDHNLIHVRRQGVKDPAFIYLMKPEPYSAKEGSNMTPHEGSNMTPHEGSNMTLNSNTELNNTELNNNENLSIATEEKTKKEVGQNLNQINSEIKTLEQSDIPMFIKKRLAKQTMIDRLILLSNKLSINLENLLQDIEDLYNDFKELLTVEQFTSCLVDSLNGNIAKNPKEYIRSALNKKFESFQAKKEKELTGAKKRQSEPKVDWFEKQKQERAKKTKAELKKQDSNVDVVKLLDEFIAKKEV
ncbi:replication initiator protein A [Amphibacillus cookii]|uniref:replication initiator protein A n=1 Tax=Amphibacillus cookii TaxID=767787 RepID=UPI00195B55BA|nr:replication initiator protein A [Amphibacillus cookii]MBM7543243.1 hypothetical protein [Amphibacillus cookii]